MPLDQLHRDPVVADVARRNLFQHLERAAKCEHCDWQLPVREVPYYEVMLPEIQQSRAYARLLSLRIRYQIAEGDFEGAIRSAEAGIALGQNLARGNSIVGTLIGIAVAEYTVDRLFEYVQQADAPNLYWALSSLPRPLVEIEDGLLSEVDAMEMSFPVLGKLEQDDLGEEYWHNALQQLWLVAKEKFQWPVTNRPLDEWKDDAYESAKEWLADAGLAKEKVDSMCVARVLLLHASLENQQQMQRRYALAHLGYPDAIRRLANEDDPDEADKRLIPPVSADFAAVLQGRIRLDQKIALLRTIESLRDYVARHDGRFPEALSDAERLPIPHDPKTGQPFPYRRQGGRATLDVEIAGWESKQLVVSTETP